jgi:hypothetical protein
MQSMQILRLEYAEFRSNVMQILRLECAEFRRNVIQARGTWGGSRQVGRQASSSCGLIPNP